MAKDNTIKLIGKLELQIDSLELTATIFFKKNLSQEVWDLDSVYKLILNNGIADPLSRQNLGKNLQTWLKLPKEEFSLVVAAGIAPEKTIHETLEWQNLEIPGELKDKAEEVFSNAQLPEIYDITKEKIKTEKTVKQKSLLPFIPGKEEKVSKWEIIEKRTLVDINPGVKFKGYVHKGEVIARIIPGRIGKPGRNIYNKPISPEKIKKVGYYTGNGVSKGFSEFKAAEDGFIRCGENWVDIIPFKVQTLRVYRSPDYKTCLLDFVPGPGNNNLPDLNLIYQQAEELGFAETQLINKETLQKSLKEAITRQVPVEKKRLNRKIDAAIEITIPPDKSRALLTLVKASGNGKELDLKEVGREINQLKITGMDKQKVQKDILNFYHSPERILMEYPLVEGKLPVRGKDGELSFICTFINPDERNELLLKLKKDYKRRRLESESKFPVTAINELANTERNQKIANIIPPTFGQPGVDIYGNEIPPVRGNDPDINIYENILISRNDILAAANGVLEMGKSGNTTLLRIRETRDAGIELKISELRTKAFLTLYPVKGIGRTLEKADIENEFQKHDIVKGIKEDKLSELLKKVQKGELVKEELIAEGLPPVHGTGQRLLFHVKIAGNSMDMGGDGKSTDENHTGSYVKKDSIIAEIFPPAIRPKDGWDITGQVLPADTGMVIGIQAGKNIKTVKETTGTVRFIAEIEGEVFYDGKNIEIKDQQVIRGDVQADAGAISAAGSLLIDGSVLSGARVFSNGNIHIGKNIQEAIVSAGGTLYAGNEIIGNKHTVLRSKGDIHFNKADAAIFLSVGNIIIKDRCLNSTLKCNGRILFGISGDTLAGGIIKARKGMELVNLGTKNHIKTYLSFGQDYLISDQIEIEEKEIQKLNRQIEMLDLQMKSSDNMDKEAIFKIRKAKRLALKTIEKRNYRLFMLREKFEEHFPSEIIVKGCVYPGVVIESHDRIHVIRKEKTKVIFFFNTKNGKIEERPL